MRCHDAALSEPQGTATDGHEVIFAPIEQCISLTHDRLVKRFRIILAFIISLALGAAGPPGYAYVDAVTSPDTDSALVSAAPGLAVTAPHVCHECDDCSCPEPRSTCSVHCAALTAAMGILLTVVPLPLCVAHDRCRSDCRIVVGRGHPPDPFPPRT